MRLYVGLPSLLSLLYEDAPAVRKSALASSMSVFAVPKIGFPGLIIRGNISIPFLTLGEIVCLIFGDLYLADNVKSSLVRFDIPS